MRRKWFGPVAAGLLVVIVVVVVLVRGAPVGRAALPDPRNGRAFIQSNLWSTDDSQYAVWVAPDDTPMVGRRALGDDAWEVETLAEVPGNPLAAPTEDNLHNVYAVAVDSLGYVHVIGNMHTDPVRYVRSVRPNDISEWQAARLDEVEERVTYPMIVALPDDTLLLFVRQRSDRGTGWILAERLDPGATDWEALGAVLEGRDGESPYIHDVALDPADGSVHLLSTWRTGLGPETNEDLTYVRSRDGGTTWETSDGRTLAAPIARDEAELVLDTGAVPGFPMNQGGMTVDDEGRPRAVVVMDRGSTEVVTLVSLISGAWVVEDVDTRLDGRPDLLTHPDGELILLGSSGGTLTSVVLDGSSVQDVVSLGRVPVGWEPAHDEQALRHRGVIETLVPRGREPAVIDVTASTG